MHRWIYKVGAILVASTVGLAPTLATANEDVTAEAVLAASEAPAEPVAEPTSVLASEPTAEQDPASSATTEPATNTPEAAESASAPGEKPLTESAPALDNPDQTTQDVTTENTDVPTDSAQTQAEPDLTEPTGEATSDVVDQTEAKAAEPIDFDVYPPAVGIYPESAKVFDRDGDGKYVIGEPVPGGTAVGPVPAGLEKYYSQKVEWQPCSAFGYSDFAGYDGAAMGDTGYSVGGARSLECAYVVVPVDYSQPNGQTMAVAVMRADASENQFTEPFYADHPQFHGEYVFMNPGGPGGDALQMVENYTDVAGFIHANYLPDGTIEWDYEKTSGLAPYNLVGVSPRGTRSSLPNLICESAVAEAAIDAMDIPADQYDDYYAWRANECMTNSVAAFDGIDGKSFINNSGMTNTARDMDVVRSVLGAEKINYYGVSYGSKLGYEYANQFPSNMSNFVIDSPENLFSENPAGLNDYTDTAFVPENAGSRVVQQRIAIEETFRLYLEGCLEGTYGACPLANEDLLGTTTVDQAYANYVTLVRQAVDNESFFHADDPDRSVPFDELNWGTFRAMYSERYWGQLTSALTDLAENGNAQGMLDLTDAYYGRKWNPDTNEYEYPPSANQPGRFETLRCVDTNETGALRGAENAEAIAQAAPWMSSGAPIDLSDYSVGSYCDQFKDSDKLTAGKELTNLPIVLTAGGTNDFATPFWQSVIAADLFNGYLLIVDHASHGVYYNQQCATNIINHFYIVGEDQFDQDFEAGLFNEPAYTGPINVSTLNAQSEPIIGTQCQLVSFKDTPAVEPVPVDPTDEVETIDEPEPTEPTVQPEPTEPTVQPAEDAVEEAVVGAQSPSGTMSAAKNLASQTPVPKAQPTEAAGGLKHTGASVAGIGALSLVLLGAGVTLRRRATESS